MIRRDNCVYLISYINEQREKSFVFLDSAASQMHLLEKQCARRKHIDFTQYGRVILYGKGDPDITATEYIYALYGNYVVNAL